MTKGYFFCTLCALLTITTLWVSPTFAQQEAGDSEIQFSGSAITTTESSNTTVFASVKLGRYFTRALEIGVTTSLRARYNEGGRFQEEGLSFGGTGGGFITYSVLSGDAETVPYIGAQYSRSLERSFEEDKGSAGVNAGIKFYLNRYAALDVGGNYLFSLERAETGTILFQFGVSFII